MTHARPGLEFVSTALLSTAFLVGACGATPDTGDATATPTASPTQTAVSPSPSPTWLVYTDTQYGFTISYPSGFTFQDQGAGPPGAIQIYRAVDSRYLTGDPPGQVDLDIISMDTATLSEWIAKHTGPSSAPPSQEFYWETTANVTPTSAAGHQAISFDNSSPGGPGTVHAIAFLQTSSRVILIDWFSTDPSYADAIQSVYQQMLASFRG